MSDFKKITNLFDELSIGYTIEDSEGGYMIDGKVMKIEGGKKVILEANHHASVIGYNGFTSEYYFDKEGKFVNVGIWE